MKKFISILMLTIIMTVTLCACDIDLPETSLEVPAADDGEKLSFVAEFYDNQGSKFFSVEGNSFNIRPNKVKEYAYDTDGVWTYSYTTSSIVSIDIDGNSIESCGSTVLFYDTHLEKYEIEIPNEVSTGVTGEANITTPREDYSVQWVDQWTLDWWWRTKQLENDNIGSRVVIIQSQEGDPICMFAGESVSWTVCKNLPKTTQLTIDGRSVFIHRANFTIIDTGLLK